MFQLFLLALTALCSSTSARVLRDWQKPLVKSENKQIIPLTLDTNTRNYFFPTPFSSTHDPTQPELCALECLADHEPGIDSPIRKSPYTISLHIPLNVDEEGFIALSPPSHSCIEHNIGEEELIWRNTIVPGKEVPITHAGVQRGGILSLQAFSMRIAPETPHISLPDSLYGILMLATNAETRYFPHTNTFEGIVECASVDTLPDIVVRMRDVGAVEDSEVVEGEGEDKEEQEIVVTPEQYILREKVTDPEEGVEETCMLMVKRGGERGNREVVLGWAALRGRKVVLDWTYYRTGLGM